jgi:hypothetical protein
MVDSMIYDHVYLNLVLGLFKNTSENDVLRREKDVLENELRIQQELVAKYQVQQQANGHVNRSNRSDDALLHQKQALEKKLSQLCR